MSDTSTTPSLSEFGDDRDSQTTTPSMSPEPHRPRGLGRGYFPLRATHRASTASRSAPTSADGSASTSRLNTQLSGAIEQTRPVPEAPAGTRVVFYSQLPGAAEIIHIDHHPKGEGEGVHQDQESTGSMEAGTSNSIREVTRDMAELSASGVTSESDERTHPGNNERELCDENGDFISKFHKFAAHSRSLVEPEETDQ